MDTDIEIIIENEYIGKRSFEELFNELNKEIIEKMRRSILIRSLNRMFAFCR